MKLVIVTGSSRTFLSATGIFVYNELVTVESTAAPVQLRSSLQFTLRPRRFHPPSLCSVTADTCTA